MTLKNDVKSKGKLNCSFKHDMKNWVNFHESPQKFENLYFDGLFLSKAYDVSARKSQRNYVL